MVEECNQLDEETSIEESNGDNDSDKPATGYETIKGRRSNHTWSGALPGKLLTRAYLRQGTYTRISYGKPRSVGPRRRSKTGAKRIPKRKDRTIPDNVVFSALGRLKPSQTRPFLSPYTRAPSS